MAEHHPTFAPSSMPMLEQCPCFERGDDSWSLEPTSKTDYRDRGTVLHKVFEARMRGDAIPAVDDLTHYELEGIDWAVDYVKANMTVTYPVEIEQRMVLMDDKFNVVTYGTGDVVNGPQMFDLKSGEFHNYWLQIATYALMQMERAGFDRVEFTLLFMRFKKAVQLVIEREEAERRVNVVVKAVLDPDKKPRANPYCKWCRKILTCEAILHLASGTECERYEIEDPTALSAALKTARILKEWVSRVEYYAKQQAVLGTVIPDFELKIRQGAREIMDVERAYELAGIPPKEFIRLCNVPIGAIEDFIAAQESITKSKAKKFVNDRLGAIIRRRDPSTRLAQINEEPTER